MIFGIALAIGWLSQFPFISSLNLWGMTLWIQRRSMCKGQNKIRNKRSSIWRGHDRKRVDMNESTYLITFDDASPTDANRYADELRNALLNAAPDIVVQRARDDPQAQDFGATLILILGTPAAAAVVAAVGNWLKLRQSASITWKTEHEQILVQHITSKDAAQLAQLLLTKK